MQFFALLLIFWVIMGIAGSGKNKKGRNSQPARRVRFPVDFPSAPAAGKPKAQPAEGDCDHEEHYGSTLQTAAPTISAATARQPYMGSIQMTELTEGVDPCHDDVAPMAVYEDEASAPAGHGFLNLSPNAMVNAIVMNEVLKRPGR